MQDDLPNLLKKLYKFEFNDHIKLNNLFQNVLSIFY